MASGRSFTSIALQLLKAGADVNASAANGVTALSLAQTTSMAKALLHWGARPDSASDDGQTVLHAYVTYHSLSLVTLLLSQKGVHVNAGDDIGSTPLFYAVFDAEQAKKDGHHDDYLADLKIAHALVKAGSDPNRANKSKDSPLSLARRSSDMQLLAVLKRA